ncbi:hypothetical protein LDENG_00284690, partial [Lucifuga dentata]
PDAGSRAEQKTREDGPDAGSRAEQADWNRSGSMFMAPCSNPYRTDDSNGWSRPRSPGWTGSCDDRSEPRISGGSDRGLEHRNSGGTDGRSESRRTGDLDGWSELRRTGDSGG